ncbi:MAG TPA: AMP-binding protein [Acidimicrobiales bacterium]|nr:AMP-binding protein [Acidimicrobiales bacterium]
MNIATIIEGHPDGATALIAPDDTKITYGELRERVESLRGGLAAMGVEPGDRVAIVTGNTPSFVTSYLAVVGLGAVAVLCNPSSPEAELARELRSVTTTFVIVGPAAAAAISRLEVGTVIAADGAQVEGATALSDIGGDRLGLGQSSSSDLAVLVFTSGTAGAPKAAMLTHGNLLANLDQIQRHPGREVQSDDVAFGVLPLFHIFGLNVVLGLTLHAGGCVVLREHFEPVAAAADIGRHGVTLLAGAPPMFGAWVSAAASVSATTFAKVRLAVSGAAPLAAEAARSFEEHFGIPLREGYGLTEASPVVTSSLLDQPAKPGSVGVPLPGLEVRLVDEDGDDALEGDPGEIWVKGPNVFAGYWEDPKATSAALAPGGWLRTGDVGVVDDDGEIWLVDRAKDLIIVSGFNVFPTEVEEVLKAHPSVLDAAVIGCPDPRTGERVKAYVVVGDSEVGPVDLTAHCARQLARYKCPAEIEVVDELPHASSGKLLRKDVGSRASSR